MRLRYLVVFAMSLTVSLAARADTIQTFDLFSVILPGNAIGTIDLDRQTGQFVSANIDVTGIYSGTIVMAPSQTSNAALGVTDVFLEFNYLNPGSTPIAGSGYDISLDLQLPFSDLRGYVGGAICSLEAPCPGASSVEYDSFTYGPPGGGPGFFESDFIQSGSMTPVNPTPEPSSLVLLFTGLTGVVATVRRRSRRIAARARITIR